MQELIERIRHLTSKEDRELADSVLEVSVGANKRVINELIGDDNMCEALMEVMEPQLLQREIEVRSEGLAMGTVNALRELNTGDAEIKAMLIKLYALSEEEAEKYL